MRRSKAQIRSFSLVMILPLLASCAGVEVVDRVEIVNQTQYAAHVDVRGDAGGWLPLITVQPDETKEVRDVNDQGSSWTFRFRYGRHDAFEVTMSKEELVDTSWRVGVPREFEEILREQGVPPPP